VVEEGHGSELKYDLGLDCVGEKRGMISGPSSVKKWRVE
jgi:hypothetical protein